MMEIKLANQRELNLHYSFDNFVVGSGNIQAHATAWAVAENPGKRNNLLIICGDVGLGASHLLHAIGNESLKRNPHAKVCYCTAPMFADNMYAAIRLEKMEEFHSFYSSLDLLLFDIVQFIAAKEAVQEELLLIIKELANAGKQVVLAMNKPPHELPGLERLRPHFSQGLQVTITSPDVASRLALVRHFADRHKVIISYDIVQFLATGIDTQSIRELEGYIVRLGAYASLQNIHITLDMARKCLNDLVQLVDAG
jgi:chromosomal replication initiator protein